MVISAQRLALVLVLVGTALAQDAPLPPLPSDLPVLQPVPNAGVRRATVVNPIHQQRRISLPQLPSQVRTPTAASYQPRTLTDDILKFDAVEKEIHAQPGDTNAIFFFNVTNVSTTNVVINWVRPSCGCTAAKVPPMPWTLKPGEGGEMEFTIDLRAKYGTLSKYISVDTSHGQKFLLTKIHIPDQSAPHTAKVDTRTRNMQLAMVDRQVVFKGDCASCHSAPVIGKTRGEEIFAAACAICHDTPNRASMVPDLRATAKATNEEYWKVWITHGKPGTLMPGFSKAYGGPLTEEQINTLSRFLFEKFPRAQDPDAERPAATVTGGAAVTLPNNRPSRD